MWTTYVLRRIIGAPAYEGNLVPLALTALQLILDVKDGIPPADALLATAVLALCVEKLFAEDIVVWISRGLLDDNLLPVVADLVDDPLERLAQLQVIEGGDAVGRNSNT